MDHDRDRLLRALSYDSQSGILTWRLRPVSDFKTVAASKTWNTRFSGNEIRCVDNEGHVLFGLDYRLMYAHRAIWIMELGAIPEKLEVDHIDGDPANNRLSNLRIVTPSVNQRNSRRQVNNTSGVTGVSWDASHGLWDASVYMFKKRHRVGRFKKLADAERAIKAFRSGHGFSDRHGEPSAIKAVS